MQHPSGSISGPLFSLKSHFIYYIIIPYSLTGRAGTQNAEASRGRLNLARQRGPMLDGRGTAMLLPTTPAMFVRAWHDRGGPTVALAVSVVA